MSAAQGITTENPALDEWRACFGDDHFNTYERRRFPLDAHTHRRRVTSVYSFAVPTDEALDAIASYGPVVEIGAGTGYWASLLEDRGCDVVAYDLLDEAFHKWFPTGTGLLYADVQRGGVEKAAEHADRTLLLVWPPMSSMAIDALRAYALAGGRRLVYVGEGYGGCTADDAFFEALHTGCRSDWDTVVCLHKTPWREVRAVEIPQWDGLHDYLAVYERAS